jgi:hypothetical protein
MEQLSIVRKRSRVWPIVIALIVVALLVGAALWFLGDQPARAAAATGSLARLIGGPGLVSADGA